MKIVNLDKFNKMPYSEEGQDNEIRWINLRTDDNGKTFYPVSYKWMCKDFLNDAICSYHNKVKYKIYGFECDPEKFYNFEWAGMPVLLLQCTKSFVKNIENVVNPYLKEQGMPVLELQEVPEGIFCNIPEQYLKNTLFISAITLFIRMASIEKAYTDFEKLAKDPDNLHDLTYWKSAMSKPMGKFPKKLQDYLFVYKEEKNGKKFGEPIEMVSHMHNCGVHNWDWA